MPEPNISYDTYDKDPIAWSKMSGNSSWEKLNSTLSNLLVGAASVFETDKKAL